METLFKKSLTELVRGIRANKKNEQQFISKCLQEIKEELRLVNKKAKMIAVQKLTYLHMLGYDVTWAAFNIIEVMSQPLFTSKRIGYLAASQVFSKDTDVVMLTTNLFRKDLQSVNQYETGLAINCLSNICNTDLARDLAPDFVTLLTSSRPYIRKKAVLALYKIFLQFPQALRPAYPRLKEKLEDSDMTVVCAAVNVICELARKNPKNYLGLAPILFKILTMSTNNWMLIKIIKLFGSLTPIEPRLARKLVEPLTNIMNTTSAMSLLYECIQTCTIGLTDNPNIIRLCITKLRQFIENPDQNLKYLGLLALSKLMPVAPKAIQEHREMVINCLDDEDVTIRLRALDLIVGMVNKRNLMDIIKKLMDKLHDAEDGIYQDDLIAKIIDICSQNSYAFITDFEWYITVLVELTHTQGTTHGKRISDQLLDVCIRVNIIREFGVKNMVTLLQDSRFTGENPTENGICEVLYAAAWIVGEFATFTLGEYANLIEIFLHPRVTNLPGHIQSVYIHNSLKLFAKIASKNGAKSKNESLFSGSEAKDPLQSAINILKNRLPTFSKSSHLETQERACFSLEIINLVESLGPVAVNELAPLFSEPLNPVSSKAWKKVPVPQGLDLNQQIHTPPPSDDEDSSSDEEWTAPSHTFDMPSKKPDFEEERKRRVQRHANDPFYLGNKNNFEDEDAPEIEVLTDASLNASSKNVLFPSLSGSGAAAKRKKKIHILKTEELPEGATADSSSDDEKRGEDPFAGIDLTSSLKPEEELKVNSYPVPTVGLAREEAPQKLSREERKKQRRRKREGKDEDDGRRERGERGDRRDRKDRRDRRERPDRERKERKESPSQGGSGVADLLQLGNVEKPVSSPIVEERRSKEDRKKRPKNNNNQVAQQAPAPSPSAPPSVPNIQLAGQNNNIKVGYEFGINPAQPDKVMAIFHLKSAAEQLSEFEFKIVETLNTKLTSFSDPKVNLLIPPSSVNSHRLLFQFKSFLQPQKLSGTLLYNANGVPNSLPLNIVIPCSTFVQSADITEDQFMSLMEKDRATLSSSTGQIQVKDARVALEKVTELLHVKVVALSSAALLYGRSTQGHNVFLLIKNRNNNLSIEIKTPNSTFSAGLLQELQTTLA